MSERITIDLTADEALVLYEWLSELDDKLPVGEAEQRVLWRVEGALEAQVAPVFAANYAELVEQARRRILAP